MEPVHIHDGLLARNLHTKAEHPALLSYNYNLNKKTDNPGQLMDIAKNNRQLPNKETIIKHHTTTDPKTNLTLDTMKKKHKNIAIDIYKNQADLLQRQQLPKSKDKEQRKNNETSFNEVVTKFKKLFDEKIKFVRDQADTLTERVDNSKQKKSYGVELTAEAKMKKTGSSTNLANKKNTSKQGFSELISDIEAKLNMHRKIKQKEKANQTERQFISIDDNQTFPLKSLYKPRIKSNKSKEKTNKSKSKSKQKYGSTSRNLSAIKKTERVNAFQSFEENGEAEKQQKGKSKNKTHRAQSNKIGKRVQPIDNAVEDRIEGNLTIRQKSSNKYRSGNLSQGKYKSRMKTFQSEQVNEAENQFRKEKIKNKKPSQKTKKQTGMKIKTRQEKIKQKNKQKHVKSRKTLQPKASKNTLFVFEKSKQKRKATKNPLERDSEQLKKKTLVNNNLVVMVGNKEKGRIPEPAKQFLFSNNLHSRVSSSSEKDSQAECSSEQQDSSLQNQSIEGSEPDKRSSEGKIQPVLGSVIMYDVGQEGDLKFSRQIESDNEQRQNYPALTSVKQLKNMSSRLIMCYIRGFTQYIKFINKQKLLTQFLSSKSFEQNQKSQREMVFPQEKPRFQEEKQQQQQEKLYIKIEHALKEEELKWLHFKKSLERIRKCDNFSEQLQKIIIEAEENHLALKSMEIKDATNPLAYQNLKNNEQKLEISRLQNRRQNELFEKDVEIPRSTFKTVTINKQRPVTRNYTEQNSQNSSDLGATLRTPIRNQGNQINININISDAEIKIQSPNKNYAIKNKGEKAERSQELIYQNQPKMEIVIKKEQKPTNIEMDQGDIIKKSLTDSEISLRNLMDQCCNQKSKQESAKSKIESVLPICKEDFQVSENKVKDIGMKNKEETQSKAEPIKIQEKVKDVVVKKKKLSYEEAPLQIKKILHKGLEVEEQKETKAKQKKKLLLQSELDLSEFMSSKAMDHSLENSSASNKNDKRIKIFEEIKSPSSYHNVYHLFKNNGSENEGNDTRVEKEPGRNRIKISLFNSNNSSKSNVSKEYKSEGHLELVHSENKLLSKSGNKNFILLKPKKVQSLSSSHLNQAPLKGVVVEKSLQQEESAKKQQYLNSQSWLIQDQQALKQLQSVFETKKQNGTNTINNKQRIREEEQFIVQEDTNLNKESSQQQRIDCTPQPFAYEKYASGQPKEPQSNLIKEGIVDEAQEEQESEEAENIFRKSTPPAKIDNYSQCELLIAEECIGQFIAELIQVDEFEVPQLADNGQWVYNKIGKQLISYYSSHNIEIQQEPNIEDATTSPYREIRQYQPEQQPSSPTNQDQSNPNHLEVDKAHVDDSYIINLVSDLFDFLQSHNQQYDQFAGRIKKPLGVDTLQLLKILRDNDIGTSALRDGDAGGLEGELDQFFEPDQHFIDEDTEDYYIISLETLARFENEKFVGESNTNQQFFNQAIYDKINMLLDNLRPYGTKGLPVLNFMHNYKTRDPLTKALTYNTSACQNPKMNKHRPFEQIKFYVLEELIKIFKIKLGLFSFNFESDKIIQYSFEKLVSQYAMEMDEQWRTLNDGDFQVKHSIMLGLEEWIVMEEIKTISRLLSRRKELANND